ncbi:MAG TPA: hypothetical protein EYN69_06470 [Flavobacteriales bacterium]|nr:hypothetical protein [Flavobacteriales bacterium]
MNWKNIVFVGAICLSGICCKKNEIPETIPYEETRFVIIEPLDFSIPSIIGLTLPFQIPFLDVSLDFSTSAENTNPHITLIRDIYLRDFIINITSPQSQTFGFLNDIEVYISTDVLPEIKMAHHYNVDNGIGSELHLVPEGEVLDDYLKSESFDLRLELVADELIFSDLTIEGEWVLDVELINHP